MAGYPPPFPPPTGSPYGYDPRQQRRILRDQAKAQRDMFKAQRDLYRQQQRNVLMQARGMRRGSILGPLIVVAVGVMLLIVRVGWLPFPRFAASYGRWWPLLFVAAGLVLVLEWAFDQRERPGQTPQVRRRIGGGVFLLLLVLAVTGAIVRGMNDQDLWAHGFSINPDNWAEFLGDKHEREQSLDHGFPAGTSLSIDDPHGDITLSGTSSDGQIHIVANKQVYAGSDSDADEKAQGLSPDLEFADGRLSLTVPSRSGATVDLTITVPDFAQATINSGRGDIHVSELKAAVSIAADHGDVDVNGVQGAVMVHTSHRDSSFSAQAITGDVSLKGNADDLNLTGITGSVLLDGDFYGDTHLEHITGTTSFRTSRTSFSTARLDGTMDISPEAELTGDQIVGPTVLTTRSRNITLQHTTGDLNVTDSNGTVDLSTAAPLGDVTIHNRNGSVTLTMPQGSGFTVQAETTGGEISNDFGGSSLPGNRANSLMATIGSGHSRIMITTTHGDVALRKGTESAPPPAPPATPPPAKPVKPGASVSF
jgi:DUF4097 and DUF4098 domain-containing protein YvlB